MWCADGWKDYELIDTSDGERFPVAIREQSGVLCLHSR